MLSSDRVVIEHAFGLLKGRWRRTQYINTYNLCKSIEIAAASCVLHNFCIRNMDLWDEEATTSNLGLENNEEPVQTEGQIKRNQIAEELFQMS